MMNALRRLADLPGVRRVLLQPRVRHSLAAVAALRFLVVAKRPRRPVRFVWNDLVAARHRVRRYTLRDGTPLMLVHRRDTEAFHELFVGGEYDPPEELSARLESPRRIIDVGANIGMFSHWAARRWPGAHLTAIEPSPENLETLRVWLARSNARIDLIEACAMTGNGHARADRGTGAGSTFVLTQDEDGLPAIDIFPVLRGADLIKIDIEGGEWPILSDPRLSDLHDVTMVLEYHRVGAPYLPAREAATTLLERAGFTVGFGQPNYWGHGTLWAWKD